METLGAFAVIFWLFLIVLAILWMCMPFALFGTKPILRQLLEEQKETNRLLRALNDKAEGPATSLVSEKYR